jgi:predicted nucleic acid-binding protein
MAVVFDAGFLVPLLDARVKLGTTPEAKLSHLLAVLEKAKHKILIPTPALSEVLIGAGEAAPQYLDFLKGQKWFEIVPFDQLAAIEAAETMRAAKQQGDKRSGTSSTWQKVKFDQQIVAIAKVKGAQAIYSTDGDIEHYLKGSAIECFNFEKLPLPPQKAQIELILDAPAEESQPVGG